MLLQSLSKSIFQLFTERQKFGLVETESIADMKLNIAKMMISLFYRVENIVGKGENAGYQHLLLYSQCFPKLSLRGGGSVKVRIVCQRVQYHYLFKIKHPENIFEIGEHHKNISTMNVFKIST